MCQLALVRWETSVILSNVSSVSIILRALGGLSYLSMNFLSRPPIRLGKKKKADCLGWTHSALISFNHISFLNFPHHPFFHSIWRSIFTNFKANLHSLPNFNLPLSFPLLVCCFHITLSAWTIIKPTLSEHVSLCSIPWKAGLTGQPWVHHLPCLPQSSVLWIPWLLCWNCSPSPQMRAAGLGAISQTRPVRGLQHWTEGMVHLCWACFIPLPPATSSLPTSLVILAQSPLITSFLWPDHVYMSRVPCGLCTFFCFSFYILFFSKFTRSYSLGNNPTEMVYHSRVLPTLQTLMSKFVLNIMMWIEWITNNSKQLLTCQVQN